MINLRVKFSVLMCLLFCSYKAESKEISVDGVCATKGFKDYVIFNFEDKILLNKNLVLFAEIVDLKTKRKTFHCLHQAKGNEYSSNYKMDSRKLLYLTRVYEGLQFKHSQIVAFEGNRCDSKLTYLGSYKPLKKVERYETPVAGCQKRTIIEYDLSS